MQQRGTRIQPFEPISCQAVGGRSNAVSNVIEPQRERIGARVTLWKSLGNPEENQGYAAKTKRRCCKSIV